MKKVLILMAQPPGGTGVQGLRYSKLLPHVDGAKWDLHFAGPSPRLTSVKIEPPACSSDHCHYTDNVSASTRISILKNRFPRASLVYYSCGVLQLICLTVEKLIHHDSFAYLRKGLMRSCKNANKILDFDLIAAKSPDFRILETGAALARELGKPFLAMYDDPHGQRDLDNFYPDDRDRQINAIEQADGVLFMSPMTRDRYVENRLVPREKTYVISDSYPVHPSYYQQDVCDYESSSQRSIRFVHLGNLPEWRPIDTFLEAMENMDSRVGLTSLQMIFYGYVYPGAKQLLGQDSRLASHFNFLPAVDHMESHCVAGQSDVLLVMIGARHIDNQPSKFFVYLGHHKPVLVIGPLGNPIQAIIENLGVGVYCDVSDPLAIEAGMKRIVEDYKHYCNAYAKNSSKIQEYRADRVSSRLTAVFEATIKAGSTSDVLSTVFA